MRNNNVKKDLKTKSGNFRKGSTKREQPRKDSKTKRINFDNARKDRVEKDIEEGMMKETGNNPVFWNQNPELLKSAGSLPFASVLGTSIGANSVPGIFTFTIAPSIGGGEALAANKMFREMYSFLVHANSRNYSYNSSDLGIVILAGIEIFTAIEELKRAYGIMKFYAEQNQYTPDSIVAALGFNPYSVRSSLGEAWYGINNLINQTKQIWIPKELLLLQRRIQLASSVYTDATGFRSQMYVFRRKIFWKYNETVSTTGGCLVPVEMTRTPHEDSVNTSVFTTMSSAISVVQGMINALLQSEDRGIMYGDILKAYGADKIYATDMINSDYIVVPEYNAEMLMQIENLTISSEYQGFVVQTATTSANPVEPAAVPIWVQENYVTTSSTWSAPSLASNLDSDSNGYRNVPCPDQILNMHFPGQPTPDQVAIATRLKVGGWRFYNPWTFSVASGTGKITPGATSDLRLAPNTCGTETVVSACFLTKPVFSYANATTRNLYYDDFFSSGLDINTIGIDRYWHNISLMAFDWHPFIYELNIKDTDTAKAAHGFATEYSSAYGDFDNYILLSNDELVKLNQACMYSIFTTVKI